MMQTRCPACATAFRVTPEQLKAKHGKVRCGQCQHVFNALDSLLEALPAEPESDADFLPEEVADASDHAQPPPGTEPVAEGSVAMGELVRSLDGFNMAEDQVEVVVVKVEPAVEPPPLSAAEMPPIPSDLPSPAVPEPVPAPSVPPIEPAEQSAAQPVKEPAVTAPAQSIANADPAWLAEDGDALLTEDTASPPRRTWPWALAALLALLLLLVQVLVQFRVELAVLSPESKPALRALCANLGCDLPLPQKANLLGIETSDLRPDARNKGQLVLTATLKNRAPFAQTYPALELTLTDTADQALLRKVLAAPEYLPKNADAAGFAANSELALTLSLVPDGSINAAAAGYRLYLFYP